MNRSNQPLRGAPTPVLSFSLSQGVFGIWDPSLDPVLVEMAQAWWYLDPAAAAADLGFAPRDPKLTVQDTVAWLREHKHLF